MFVMGGGVKGGRVFGKWPGLTRDVLEGPGDLPVVTNYRNILAPSCGATAREIRLTSFSPISIFIL